VRDPQLPAGARFFPRPPFLPDMLTPLSFCDEEEGCRLVGLATWVSFIFSFWDPLEPERLKTGAVSFSLLL